MSNENTSTIAHILYDRSLTMQLLRCGMAAPYVRAISDKTCQQKMSTPTTTSTTPTSTRGIGLSANIHKRNIFSPTLRGQPNRDSIHCTTSLHSTAQHCTTQHSSTLHSKAQHCTAQLNTAQQCGQRLSLARSSRAVRPSVRLSVCLSVRPSSRPSVRPSVRVRSLSCGPCSLT